MQSFYKSNELPVKVNQEYFHILDKWIYDLS